MKAIKEKQLVIYLLIIWGFLFLPLLQIGLRVFPGTRLEGIYIPNTRVVFSRLLFIEEKFQQSVEDYLVRGNELRSYAIKLGNQFYYSLFNQVSARLNNSVLSGEQGYFFQYMYLQAVNKTKVLDTERADLAVDELVQLQKLLKERGKTLVLLISPNLINLYPDTLPNGYRNLLAQDKMNTYDYMLPKLKEKGLNLVDTFDLLKRLDNINGLRFFQKTGSHLNDLGVCLQINELLSLVAREKGKTFKPNDCSNYELVDPPLKKDLDLVRIVNLLYPERLFSPSPKIKTNDFGFNESYKPNLLLIGSSFLFGIQEQFERYNLVESAPLYFYNRNVRKKSTDKFKLKKNTNWTEELKKFDVVVLEINQSSVAKVGYGFAKEVGPYLNY